MNREMRDEAGAAGIDGGVCGAWEKVVGEKPTRSFK
jgi:hypothetical protein